jgi:hypothetical protein
MMLLDQQIILVVVVVAAARSVNRSPKSQIGFDCGDCQELANCFVCPTINYYTNLMNPFFACSRFTGTYHHHHHHPHPHHASAEDLTSVAGSAETEAYGRIDDQRCHFTISSIGPR